MGKVSRCRTCGEMFLGKSWNEPYCSKCQVAQAGKAMSQAPCSRCGKPSNSTYKGAPVCLECWQKAYREEAGQ